MDGKVLENSMAVYLNTNSALILYKELKNSEYFVDKSSMIEAIYKIYLYYKAPPFR